jgi:hypothetical protein
MFHCRAATCAADALDDAVERLARFRGLEWLVEHHEIHAIDRGGDQQHGEERHVDCGSPPGYYGCGAARAED